MFEPSDPLSFSMCVLGNVINLKEDVLQTLRTHKVLLPGLRYQLRSFLDCMLVVLALDPARLDGAGPAESRP